MDGASPRSALGDRGPPGRAAGTDRERATEPRAAGPARGTPLALGAREMSDLFASDLALFALTSLGLCVTAVVIVRDVVKATPLPATEQPEGDTPLERAA